MGRSRGPKQQKCGVGTVIIVCRDLTGLGSTADLVTEEINLGSFWFFLMKHTVNFLLSGFGF